MKYIFSLETQQEIVNRYLEPGVDCKSISQDYGVGHGVIVRLLRKKGIKIKDQHEYKRKYTVNDHYFDQIDTPEKAYFLGLLYADGCNYEPTGVIILSLQERDKTILEKFNAAIGSNKPLQYYKAKKSSHQNHYRLSINSFKMSKSLSRLGCFQAKSLKLLFPTQEQLPKKFNRDFMRGYFDGDGCFSFSWTKSKNSRSPDASIVSTEHFCNRYTQIITEELDLVSSISKQGKCFVARIRGSKSLKFLEWLYTDASLYLQRKYDKYEEYLAWLSTWVPMKKGRAKLSKVSFVVME